MPEKNERGKLLLSLSLITVMMIGAGYLAITGYLQSIVSDISFMFSSRENLRAYIESFGALAPIAFISIQALQVVFAPIPGELTGAVGGFIFGVWPNVIYSTIGLTIGSVLAFMAARVIGLPLVKLVVSSKLLNRFEFLTHSKGILVALAFFIIPGFPKDILSYILGLSPMGFLTFLLVCALGRIPGTILLSYSGAAVYDENWLLLASLTILCAIVISIFYFKRTQIELWLKTRKEHQL
ncbi:MAG: TVP38/TMEM64 family protein [Syntrophaceae bacterium]|nr:TVP38/TMEM64 family protein [Syntrophaceae bacterium]